MQPRDPDDPLGQPGLTQAPAGLVLHLHIVMILSPVISHEQHVHISRLSNSPGQ